MFCRPSTPGALYGLRFWITAQMSWWEKMPYAWCSFVYTVVGITRATGGGQREEGFGQCLSFIPILDGWVFNPSGEVVVRVDILALA